MSDSGSVAGLTQRNIYNFAGTAILACRSVIKVLKITTISYIKVLIILNVYCKKALSSKLSATSVLKRLTYGISREQ